MDQDDTVNLRVKDVAFILILVVPTRGQSLTLVPLSASTPEPLRDLVVSCVLLGCLGPSVSSRDAMAQVYS